MSQRARRSARGKYGLGTVERRGKTWWVRRHRIVDGQSSQYRVGPFATRADAEAERDRTVPLRGNAASNAADWLTRWAERTSAELRLDQRESMAAIYQRHVRLHLAPGLEGYLLGEVRPSDLNTLWRQLLSEKGLSRKTVTNIRGTLSRALSDAVADSIIISNPVRDSRLPVRHRGALDGDEKAGRGRQRAVARRELDLLLDYLLDSESVWAAPMILVRETGLRRGEALAVSWDQYDRAAGTLTIRRQVEQLDTGEIVIRPVKTAASNRTIQLTREAKMLFRAILNQPGVASVERLVFKDRRGQPLNPESWSQWVRKQLRPACAFLPDDFRIHYLRHSHASFLLDEGTPESVVARRLGHASPVTTRQIYWTATEDGDREAAERWTNSATTPGPR